jgi:L-idonate 5-dehydrogenase
MPLALVIHSAKDLRLEECVSEPMGTRQVRVQVRFGGICGSDMHYYQHGGFGTVRIKQPMVLGHEVSGIVTETGTAVKDLSVGTRVSISPSRPCGLCEYCQKAHHNHCMNMRFYGSAMPWPHIQGAFRQEMVIDASQAHPVHSHVSDAQAAMAEPFSVALHAVSRAGSLMGKRVLVTGCGPIGALTVIAAQLGGASEVVVTDITDQTLNKALAVGASKVINTATHAEGLDSFKANKGYFDVMFEASGNQAAIKQGFEVLKPRGVFVQVGTGGEISIPLNVLVAKEFDYRGSFRFHSEFANAVELMNRKKVDLSPLISHQIALKDYLDAFKLAGDRTQAMKVQISFAS